MIDKKNYDKKYGAIQLDYRRIVRLLNFDIHIKMHYNKDEIKKV